MRIIRGDTLHISTNRKSNKAASTGGDTASIPTNRKYEQLQQHMFVVVCGPILRRSPDYPFPQSGEVLLVPIHSYNPNHPKHDATCLLEKGDHPFIVHTSYVNYRSARHNSEKYLLQKINSREYRTDQPMDEQIVQRIHNGFYKTRHYKNFVFDYLEHPTNRRY